MAFRTFDKSTPSLYDESAGRCACFTNKTFKNGLTYRQAGDYLLPELEVPETPKIGVWGNRREAYLREQRNGIYTGLLVTGELNAHLEEIDRSAEEMLSRLVTEMAAREQVTETLKASDQMERVRRMNSIRNRAEEVVFAEPIYV